MKKLISILCLTLLVSGLSACADARYGNTPEQQRQNSQDAQRELSTDVKK